MNKTGIEWTDYTWNPVTGCTKVSSGCDHCWAEAITKRFKRGPFEQIRLHPERLREPYQLRTPSKIFTCSMSDLFHSDVPWEFICRVFGIMELAHWHTFQVLTKRPGRMAYFAEHVWPEYQESVHPWPANVWAGTSVEMEWDGNKHLIRRLDKLAMVPAVVRYASLEPVLGPLDGLTPYLINPHLDDWLLPGQGYGAVLQWVIAGGESGPRARPAQPDWLRNVRDQCLAAGVPFFFKQWGEWLPEDHCKAGQFMGARERYGQGGPGLFEAGPECFQRWAWAGRKAAGALLDGREWREMPA